MRYKCIVEYDGTNYVGFQSQINGVAIQDEIEKALKIIFRDNIRIYMASRTDAGVHALGQVFHFDHDKIIEPRRLKAGINSNTKKDIHIKDVEVVSDEFHSRFDVKSKKYIYLVNIGEESVFLNNRAYQCFYKLDLDKIKSVLPHFVGKHDFGSFNTNSYEEYPDQTRNIISLEMFVENDILRFEIVGDGFLRHMVRMIVGSLINLGRGRLSTDEVIDMINNPHKGNKRYNIDACGLYLYEIYY